MLSDSVNMLDGSTASNLAIVGGSSFPGTTHTGELFFRTDENKLYIRNATNDAWIDLTAAGGGGGAFTEDVNDNIYGGTGALAALTAGIANFAGGNAALNILTIGNYNVSLGYESGKSITSADDNIAIGRGAINNTSGNTSGDDNVMVGAQAGQGLTTGSGNVGFGQQAGASISTGGQNTCIGSGAGANITTGGSNICIGINAGPVSNGGLSSRLYIDSTSTDTPLILADMGASNYVDINGNLLVRGNTNGGLQMRNGARIRMYEPEAGGFSYTDIIQPATGFTLTYNLPVDFPADGEVLTYNSTGNQLSWEPAGAGGLSYNNSAVRSGGSNPFTINTTQASQTHFSANTITGLATGDIILVEAELSVTTDTDGMIEVDIGTLGGLAGSSIKKGRTTTNIFAAGNMTYRLHCSATIYITNITGGNTITIPVVATWQANTGTGTINIAAKYEWTQMSL